MRIKKSAMTLSVLSNISEEPSPERALRNYRQLAVNYDATCTRIEALRLEVVHLLDIKVGETVFDVACGTGSTLPLLANAVGSKGRVVGVELSPEMARLARERVSGLPQVSVVQTSMADFRCSADARADAVLLCYAHDVLQSPVAIDQLIASARPGARIAMLGMQTLPWWWGWPTNFFNLYRARRYLTTYANMDRPWRLLEQRGAQLRLVRTALFGSAYLVVGKVPNEAHYGYGFERSLD